MSDEGREGQLPSTEWRLDDWLGALGISAVRLAQIGQNIQPLGKRWEIKRLYRWAKYGIDNALDAFSMAAVLHRVAVANHRWIFSRMYFWAHAEIFLNSQACKKQFSFPKEEEIEIFFIPGSKIAVRDTLIGRVLPPPPPLIGLYGRERDLDRVVASLRHNAITIIDGVGGDGKTALAWHAAKRAIEEGLFEGFDWNTDKRVLLTPVGKPYGYPTRSLTIEEVVSSMARRFEWNEAIEGNEHRFVERCAEKLRTGRYLIVIDNLETINDRQALIQSLSELLRGGESRVLITSRERMPPREWKHIDIGGIDIRDRLDFILDLESQFPRRVGSSISTRLLTDTQRGILAASTGSPLFTRIIVERMSFAPHAHVFERQINWLLEGINKTDETFKAIFGDVMETLDSDSRWLAFMAAQEDGIIYGDILRELWEMRLSVSQQTYGEALSVLLLRRILDLVPGSREAYAMHPMIKQYLRADDQYKG